MKKIKTKDFFKDRNNEFFRTVFSISFQKKFKSMLPDEFESIIKKPSWIVISDEYANDFWINHTYPGFLSSPVELAQKIHYIMMIDPNTEEGKKVRSGKIFFGYFVDKSGEMLYVYFFFDKLGRWQGDCSSLSKHRFHKGDFFLYNVN